jgi:hypothetical protein
MEMSGPASAYTPVYSMNKTDCHNMIELFFFNILFKSPVFTVTQATRVSLI